ncbi:hypothetical protein U9M48_002196 [Paspalum notatum var. saurae]|uniref:GH18 domain-containing protein n=1 Tax=Paspalum notatum var. saurae TaxID=547442 RepID=A0AAQ3SJK6_PASNO
MALRRRTCLLLALLGCLAAPAVGNRTGELTVFWGRNKDEGTLREACDTGLYNTVIISFYSVFGHGRYWLDLSGHRLGGVGGDIKHCQSKGIPVFLSIGGGGKNYSLPSSKSAEAVAINLWNAFLGGGSGDVFRPFGDAVVDGIDFYIDHGSSSNYDELARRLDYFNSMYYHATRKYVRLTATPRCAFPDRRVEKALQTGLFERIHVRFYGDDSCSYKNGGTYGIVEQWEKWTARYPKSQMYVGLAAGESGVPEGAPPPVEVYLKYLYYDLLPKVQKAPNYAGVMVWDRFTDKKTGYSTAVKGWASCSYGAMAFTRRRPPSAPVSSAALLSVAALILLLVGPSPASAQGPKTGQQVTVFWGRHKDEGSLREACDSGLYTMVIMSFLDVYGADGTTYHLDLSGHPLAGMGDAIKRCQFLGVPVSLSIGGSGAGAAYSLPTNASALALFDHLWNTYFGGNLTDPRRPFGDAWLDGVDMFLDHATPAEHYNTLALELAKHNIRAGDGKLLHLTATPHCRFPDPRVKEALDTGIFERVHVRFYGDGDGDCAAGFSAAEWGKWTAAYPFTEFYVGVPASPAAAGSGGGGYTDPETLRRAVLPVAKKANNYGGVMVWDRYFDKRSNYSASIKTWV